MNEYVFMLIFAAAVTTGLIAGIIAALYCFRPSKGTEYKPKHKKKKSKRKKNTDTQTQEPAEENRLKKRLGKEKDSWTSFNCMADGTDEQQHIQNSRKKEDGAYQYIKRKKM